MLLLIATYGLLRSDVSSLKVDDLPWRTGMIRVPQPKIGTPLVVPLTKEVRTRPGDCVLNFGPAETAAKLTAPSKPGSLPRARDPGLKSNPNQHRTESGSFRVRIQAGQEVVVVGETSEKRVSFLKTFGRRSEAACCVKDKEKCLRPSRRP
jgi:hypothetical protein